MAVEGVVFDVGIQTAEVLRKIAGGASWQEVVPTDDEQANGNGSLMRVLPLALWHVGSDLELVADARRSSCVTHGHLRSQLCCALYCLWARRLFFGSEHAYEEATDTLYRLVADEPMAVRELDNPIRPREEVQPFGKGYVVDTLHTVRVAMQAECFKRVVQKAIAFGNDTDTTAALAGGLAGLREGVDAIPTDWRLHEAGLTLVRPLIDRLLAWRGMGRIGELW
jgi:ADP-ribosyl-[dinitrogen reductase] hydrolase